MDSVRFGLRFAILFLFFETLALGAARADEPAATPFPFLISPGWAEVLVDGTLAEKIRAAGQAAQAVRLASKGTVMVEYAMPFLGSPPALRRRVESGDVGAVLLSRSEAQRSKIAGDDKTAVFDMGPLGVLAVNRAKFATYLDENSGGVASQLQAITKKGLEIAEKKIDSPDDKFWVRAFEAAASDPQNLSAFTELFKQGVLRLGNNLEKNPEFTRRLASDGLDNTEKYLKLVGNFLGTARSALKIGNETKLTDLPRLYAGLDDLQKKVQTVQGVINRMRDEKFQGEPEPEARRHAEGGEHEAQRQLQGSKSTTEGTHGDTPSGVSNP